MIRKLIGPIATALVLAIATREVGNAQAPSTEASTFQGTATINGQPAWELPILVYIDGKYTSCGEGGTVNGGTYALRVVPKEGCDEGDILQFRLGLSDSGAFADQTGIFRAGQTQTLNLTFTDPNLPAPTSTPQAPSTGMGTGASRDGAEWVLGGVILVLVAGGIAARFFNRPDWAYGSQDM